jgi:hypothetical protein
LGLVKCPKCEKIIEEAGFRGWQIICAILVFPFGLLALLADKKPTICFQCQTIFQAQKGNQSLRNAIAIIGVIGGIIFWILVFFGAIFAALETMEY